MSFFLYYKEVKILLYSDQDNRKMYTWNIAVLCVKLIYFIDQVKIFIFELLV